MMKKISLIVAFLSFILSSCNFNNYKVELRQGSFSSLENFTCEDDYFTSIKIVISGVSKTFYDSAQNIDVVEDLATPKSNRQYYSIKVYLSTSEEKDIYKRMTFVFSGYGRGHNTYIFGLKVFEDREDYETRLTLGLSYEIAISNYISAWIMV